MSQYSTKITVWIGFIVIFITGSFFNVELSEAGQDTSHATDMYVSYASMLRIFVVPDL